MHYRSISSVKLVLLLVVLLPQWSSLAAGSRGKEFPAPPTHFALGSPELKPVVGLRPFREGGIRLEVEKSGNTVFVHNYGHGGAGLTLSWGTVHEAVTQALPFLESGIKPVIVGGGVIGLTTAYELQAKGYQVTLHSDEHFPNNVSNIAGGLWSPVSVDLEAAEAETIARLKRIQINSWHKYQALEREGWPVRSMPMFVTEEARAKSGLDLFETLPELFTVTHHIRLPIQGVSQGGYEVNTLLIDTPKYLEALRDKVQKQGAELVKSARFRSLEEIRKLVGPNSLIFNCTGLGARELVKDDKMIPVRGDLIYIKAHAGFSPGDLGYMAFYGPQGTDYMFPRSGEIVIGGTFRKGESSLTVEVHTCEEKLASLQKFFGTEKQ